MSKRILLLTAAVAVLLCATDRPVQGGWRRAARNRSVERRRPPAAHPPAARTRYSPYERYMLDVYPKYYGAIHSRSIYNYGMPSGDIGLRGTPW